jgi:hypothetical protein
MIPTDGIPAHMQLSRRILTLSGSRSIGSQFAINGGSPENRTPRQPPLYFIA